MTTLKGRYLNLFDFENDMYQFDSFDSFYIKLLTILSLTCINGKKYCFCYKYNQNLQMVCPMCYIPMFFWNFRDDSKKNRLDPIYMGQYKERLFADLIECFVMKESSIADFAGLVF